MDKQTKSHQIGTFLLLVGAVVFGMVLAGSTGLTPSAHSAASPAAGIAPAASTLAVPPSLPSFADLADVVGPAVVSIQATSFDKGRGRGQGNDPFEFFFGPRRRGPAEPEDEGQRSDSGGSGFLVSADGLVVTNHHVIEGAADLKVRVGDREYKATLKGDDPDTDIALLKLESEETFRYLSLGDSEGLRVGDWVMVIGSPLNLDHTVTVGVVSAKGRSIGITRDSSFENFIQTDAAINFGNSGGPLVNLKGEVVGIATAINYGAENIGFAVPVSTLKQILPQLREAGRVSRGYLGVTIANLDYDGAQAYGLDEPMGALVNEVTPDTPASKAGLEHGDVLLEVDGRKIKETRDLIDYVAGRGPGVTVDLLVLRDGKRIEKKVDLAERPGGEDVAEAGEAEGDNGIEWLGIEYDDLTPALRQQFGIPAEVEGVRVRRVAQDSPLFEQGAQPNLVIVEVNGQKTPDVATFERVVGRATSGSFLRIYWRLYDGRGNSRGSHAFVRVP